MVEPQHPLTLSLRVKAADAGVQQIAQADDSREPVRILAFNNRQARPACLRHAIHHQPQRLVGKAITGSGCSRSDNGRVSKESRADWSANSSSLASTTPTSV